MKELIEEIMEFYSSRSNNPFPYDDFKQLQNDFSDEFKREVPDEIITADFNTYMMFIYGLSSGGVISRLLDPLERFRVKVWLNKSFFEWFPKYRFLESYDLTIYKDLNTEWEVIEKLRNKLIELIKLIESH